LVAYSSAVSIGRPATQIFPYLLGTTLQKLKPGAPIKPIDPSELSNGAHIEVSFGLGPLNAVCGLQISELEVGRKLAFKSYSGPITWKGEYNLAEDGKGTTTVSQIGQLKFKGLWRLVQPFASGQIKRSEVQELQRLKQVLEATPAAALPAAS